MTPVSQPPTDDDGLGAVEDNLGGPRLSKEASELSAAEEYTKPRRGPRSDVTIHAEIVVESADTGERGE